MRGRDDAVIGLVTVSSTTIRAAVVKCSNDVPCNLTVETICRNVPRVVHAVSAGGDSQGVSGRASPCIFFSSVLFRGFHSRFIRYSLGTRHRSLTSRNLAGSAGQGSPNNCIVAWMVQVPRLLQLER